MRYQLNAAFFCALLATTACGGTGPGVIHTTNINIPGGKYYLKNPVVDEYRFTDPTACTTTANQAYHNAYPNNPAGSPTLVSSNPLKYSMKAGQADVEIRFVVVPQDELDRYGKFISYFEVNRIQGGNGREDIDAAIKEFKKLPGGDVVTGAFQDAVEENGKRPWRAVMKRSENSSAASLHVADKFYGIVINPPYP